MKSICVFCGSRYGANPIYSEEAKKFALEMVSHNFTLIYGGGRVGIMGLIADTIIDAGGHVIGVIPEFLDKSEIGHPRVTQLIRVKSMHERKLKMFELSDSFVALPGGIGTQEEILEMWTWRMLQIHNLPVGLLNTNGYYDSFIEFALKMKNEEFLTNEAHRFLITSNEPKQLLSKVIESFPGRLEVLKNPSKS
jgi:uncharacterized protein (TIGR00730 family)